jgi:hypothetical protein
MKVLLLASAITAFASIGSAFASITVYTDGSTYDSSAPASQVMCPTSASPAAGECATTLAPWLSRTPKVIRFGPPENGDHGAGG